MYASWLVSEFTVPLSVGPYRIHVFKPFFAWLALPPENLDRHGVTAKPFHGAGSPVTWPTVRGDGRAEALEGDAGMFNGTMNGNARPFTVPVETGENGMQGVLVVAEKQGCVQDGDGARLPGGRPEGAGEEGEDARGAGAIRRGGVQVGGAIGEAGRYGGAVGALDNDENGIVDADAPGGDAEAFRQENGFGIGGVAGKPAGDVRGAEAREAEAHAADGDIETEALADEALHPGPADAETDGDAGEEP